MAPPSGGAFLCAPRAATVGRGGKGATRVGGEAMASDQAVSAQDVLDALSEVRRRGSGRVLEQLEAVEPVLAGHLMEELSLVHQGLLDLGARPRAVRLLVRQAESMAVVLVAALRQAHLRLWQEEESGGRL